MTHTRMCQECPVSLEKLSFFFIQVKIIQVLVFDNWHPLKMPPMRPMSTTDFTGLSVLVCDTYKNRHNLQHGSLLLVLHLYDYLEELKVSNDQELV